MLGDEGQDVVDDEQAYHVARLDEGRHEIGRAQAQAVDKEVQHRAYAHHDLNMTHSLVHFPIIDCLIKNVQLRCRRMCQNRHVLAVGTQHAASASGMAEQKCHIFVF